MLRALCHCAHLDNVSLFEGQLILLGCRKVVQRNRLHFLTAQWPPIQDKAGTRKRTKGVNNNREKNPNHQHRKVSIHKSGCFPGTQGAQHSAAHAPKQGDRTTYQPTFFFALSFVSCLLLGVGGLLWCTMAALFWLFSFVVLCPQHSSATLTSATGLVGASKVKIDLLNCKRKAILAFDGDSYKKGKSRTKSTKPNQQTNNRVAFELN